MNRSCLLGGKKMSIPYTITLTFVCPKCGVQNRITRLSGSRLSGTFCRLCDEQYWTRWDGTLHRGPLTVETATQVARSTDEL